MNKPDSIEVKLPKSFHKIMNRLGVKLRSEPITVTHRVYGTHTLCSPSVYAVYEVAVKVNFISQFLRFQQKGAYNEMLGCMQYYQSLLTDDDALPNVTDEMAADSQKCGLGADNDYVAAVRILSRAGLYYDLLD